MSNHLAVATVTVALRRTLFEVAQALVGGVAVSTGRPTNTANPGGNVFLYRVTPNAAFRNDDLATRDASGRRLRRPQLALDLHYLLSFYGDESAHVPERIMAGVMARLHARPELTPAQITAAINDPLDVAVLAASDLANQVQRVRFTPEPLDMEALSRLWAMFNGVNYALSASYVASVVLIETEAQVPAGPPVLGRTVTVLGHLRPRITRVVLAADPDGLITPQSRVAVEGVDLQGSTTEVWVAGQRVVPVAASQSRVVVDLPAGLSVGAHPILVAHPLNIGVPPVPHRGPESPPAALVVHPDVASNGAGDPLVVVTPQPGQYQVDVTVTPDVRVDQSATLELLDDQQRVVARFGAAPRAAAAPDLRFQVVFAAGTYRARIRVDFAQSPLFIDQRPGSPTAGQLLPRVVLP